MVELICLDCSVYELVQNEIDREWCNRKRFKMFTEKNQSCEKFEDKESANIKRRGW